MGHAYLRLPTPNHFFTAQQHLALCVEYLLLVSDVSCPRPYIYEAKYKYLGTIGTYAPVLQATETRSTEKKLVPLSMHAAHFYPERQGGKDISYLD